MLIHLDGNNDVYFDPEARTIFTRCTKCQSPIQLRLGPIQDAETARKALNMITGPGMCPPLANGGFAAWAHPELGFHGFWQIEAVFDLIASLVEQGILSARPGAVIEPDPGVAGGAQP